MVTQADLNAGTALVNVATVDTDQTARLTDDATSTVAQNPALTIVKELTNADDAVVDTAGETIEYTITVDNTGNVDLTGVVLDDVFAGGATLVSGDTQQQQHSRDHRDLDLLRGLRGHAGRPQRRHRSGERGGGRHRPDRPRSTTTPPPRWLRTRR